MDEKQAKRDAELNRTLLSQLHRIGFVRSTQQQQVIWRCLNSQIGSVITSPPRCGAKTVATLHSLQLLDSDQRFPQILFVCESDLLVSQIEYNVRYMSEYRDPITSCLRSSDCRRKELWVKPIYVFHQNYIHHIPEEDLAQLKCVYCLQPREDANYVRLSNFVTCPVFLLFQGDRASPGVCQTFGSLSILSPPPSVRRLPASCRHYFIPVPSEETKFHIIRQMYEDLIQQPALLLVHPLRLDWLSGHLRRYSMSFLRIDPLDPTVSPDEVLHYFYREEHHLLIGPTHCSSDVRANGVPLIVLYDRLLTPEEYIQVCGQYEEFSAAPRMVVSLLQEEDAERKANIEKQLGIELQLMTRSLSECMKQLQKVPRCFL